MPYLLNLAYLVLLLVTLPWWLYAAIRRGKYREGFGAKLLGLVPIRQGDRPCVWMHAVSVGEVNLLQPLLARLEQEHPEWECIISTTTRTGYEVARRKYAPRLVFYCPLDFSWAVRTALRRLRPDLLVLAELELWPNLVLLARRRGIPVAVINGRLSDKSFRGYQRLRWMVRRMLASIQLIAVQNAEYAARFRELGAAESSLQVTGSLKFDGAHADRSNPRTTQLAQLAGIHPSDVVLLAGSTQRPEEQIALEVFQKLASRYPRLRLLICPRHPERFDEVAELLDQAGLPWVRRSQLDEGSPAPAREARILLIDAVGELAAWWGLAHVAYVGGSMGTRGGQNMIEPSGYGAAVCFGPNTQNFRDVVSLLTSRKAAVVVHDTEEMVAFVRRCLEQPHYAAELGRRAQQLVLQQQGAADRTVQLLTELMQGRHRADASLPAAAEGGNGRSSGQVRDIEGSRS